MADPQNSTINISVTGPGLPIGASTPNPSRRRIRQSSGPPADGTVGGHDHPSARSSVTMNSTRANASTGKKRLLQATMAKAPPKEKKFDDLKLNPKDVLKVLSKITQPGDKNLHGVKLRDLVDSPKSCRNLMAQFELTERTITRAPLPLFWGNEDDDSSIDQPHASILKKTDANAEEEPATVQKADDHHSDRTKLQRLVEKLRASNTAWGEKYQQACQADYEAKRAALLNPQFVVETTGKLNKLHHSLRTLCSGQTALKVMDILRGSKDKFEEGIPCPVEDHGRIVEAIGKLDQAMWNEKLESGVQTKFADKDFDALLTEKSRSLEKELDRLQPIQVEHTVLGQMVKSQKLRLNKLERTIVMQEEDKEKFPSSSKQL